MEKPSETHVEVEEEEEDFGPKKIKTLEVSSSSN